MRIIPLILLLGFCFSQRSTFAQTPAIWKQVLKTTTPAIAMLHVTTPTGSKAGTAFQVNDKGMFFTNRHLVGGATEIFAYFDGLQNPIALSENGIRLVAEHPTIDIAALIIDARADDHVPPLTILAKNSRPQKLDDVLIVGNSHGKVHWAPLPATIQSIDTPLSVFFPTKDHNVSTQLRRQDLSVYTLNTAGGVAGLSGGPVFNLQGQVVGMLTGFHPNRIKDPDGGYVTTGIIPYCLPNDVLHDFDPEDKRNRPVGSDFKVVYGTAVVVESHDQAVPPRDELTTLNGTIVDGSLRPIDNATVTLISAENRIVNSYRADSFGRFSIRAASNSPVTLSVEAPGRPPSVISNLAPRKTQTLSLVMPSTADFGRAMEIQLRGAIVDLDGNPREGARVSLRDGVGRQHATVTTGADGSFVIQGNLNTGANLEVTSVGRLTSVVQGLAPGEHEIFLASP